jgi:hypothetical protein
MMIWTIATLRMNVNDDKLNGAFKYRVEIRDPNIEGTLTPNGARAPKGAREKVQENRGDGLMDNGSQVIRAPKGTRPTQTPGSPAHAVTHSPWPRTGLSAGV